MVEPLHQTDQGIFRHMIEVLRDDLLKGESKLLSLEKRMKVLKEEYYIQSLKNIPGYGFWISNSNVTGQEYRTVMQVKEINTSLT